MIVSTILSNLLKIKVFNKLRHTMVSSYLPYFVQGEVIKGFGRGSKELGCPTANFPRSTVQALPEDFATGVYYGWARLEDGPVYKMVMNVGWCPFYQNKEKAMETHIMKKFENDFYGETLRVCIVGFLRPEKNFNSLDELISAIQNDIDTAEEKLNSENAKKLQEHDFLSAKL